MLLIWWSSSWFHGKIEQYHLKVILEKNKDNWKFSIVMSFHAMIPLFLSVLVFLISNTPRLVLNLTEVIIYNGCIFCILYYRNLSISFDVSLILFGDSVFLHWLYLIDADSPNVQKDFSLPDQNFWIEFIKYHQTF